MFKVLKAEIKKMVSKPGIYILAVLLAIVLVLGVFIYKPTVVTEPKVAFSNRDALEVYTEFVGINESTGYKRQADLSVSQAVAKFDNYSIDSTSYNQYVSDRVVAFDSALKNYRNYSNLPPQDQNDTIKVARRNAVVNTLDNLYSFVISGINLATSGSYPIITTAENYNNLESLYKSSHDLLAQDTNQIDVVCAEFESKYKNNLLQAIDNLVYPTLSDELIASYTDDDENSKYNVLQSRLNKKMEQINQFHEVCKLNNNSINPNNVARMAELCQEYIDISNVFTSLIRYELLSNALGSVSATQQINLLHIKNESEYNAKTNLLHFDYLFTNDKTEADYAHPLTIGVTSNSKINAYDYTYFVLRLFSFIIIAYAIMAACHSIAGEVKEGSMRYFAVRPISRTNIFFGKLLAIFTMSTIITIFSTIIAFIVGWAVYGINALNILTIFNSTNAIVLHPIVMILIYVLSMLLELLVYTTLALLLSTLLKSDLLSVTLLLVIYLVNTLLPMFAGGANSWLTYYPFSHISLYALFGSSIYAPSNNFFNLLLGAKVYAGTSIIVTLCVLAVIIIAVNIISSQVFKKKEL